MKLRYFVMIYAAMALLLPVSERIAAGAGNPQWHNWTYMLGHANVLHYVLNGIGWLMMWKVATWKRTLTAYVLSALAMYAVPTTQPVLGWSAVICFYLGMCLNHSPTERKIKVVLLTLTGFLLPNIAAGLHLTMLAAGWITRKLELAWKKTL